MSKVKLLITLSVLLWNGISGQKVNIALDSRGEDADYSKLIMATEIFVFKNDSVANPLDLASAKKDDETRWKKVVAPAMDPKLRKGFAWIFGTGYADDFAPNHTLILIENPGWTNWNTLIWTDRNRNYNLTDDGPPDTLTGTGKCILSVDAKPNGFKVELEHFPVKAFSQYAGMLDKAMQILQGKRVFMGVDNCFRMRRLNLIFGSWTDGKDSFSIALKDVNCNGVYTDEGIDKAMITDKGSVFNNLQSVALSRKNTYLEWNNAAYTILQILANPAEISILRDSNVRLKYSLNVGDKLPRFRYSRVTGQKNDIKIKKVSIRKLRGKQTYIYVWHDQSERHLKDSAGLHALGRLKLEDFQVLSLNYGASGKYIYRYNKRFDTELIQGFSSNDINRKLKIKRIPEAILVDRKQRIIAVGKTPDDILQYIVKYSSTLR
jgi:hypothetical protein